MQESVNHPLVRVLGWLLAVLTVAYFATRIPHTLAIFILAAMIAFGMAPITYHLERKMPRGVAIAIVYSVLALSMLIVMLFVVPTAVVQAQTFLEVMPIQIDHVQAAVDGFTLHLQGRYGHSVGAGVRQLRDTLNLRIQDAANASFLALGTMLINAFSILFIGLSALVLSVFFIANSEDIAEGFRQLFPPNRRHLATEFEHEIARVFGGFVAGQVTLCVFTGTMVWGCLSFLHLPFAVLVGVITAFGYAVPFIGMLIVQVFAAVLAAPMGLTTLVWVTVMIFVIARLVDSIIAPKVMSESVGVSPIFVMFAVFAGGELFGLTGLVLGIPAAALVKTGWKVYQQSRSISALDNVHAVYEKFDE